MAFGRIIDKNQNINEDFKDIVKECFSEIYEFLGKKDFERWIHTRELSEDVEKLVVDYMSKEYKNENPNVLGYAKVDKSEIRLLNQDKGTATHEIYHLITRHSGRLGTYINEGITEYLKSMTSENKADSYLENVSVAKFLHNILGDSLIKAYLLGKDDEFDNKFARLISKNPNDLLKSKKEIEEFYSNLEERHSKLHSTDGKREKITQEDNKKIESMIQKIIVGKIRKMSEDLEFYQDGKLDLKLAMKSITDILSMNSFNKNSDFNYNTMKLSLEEVLENSHVLIDYSGEDKENKKNEFLDALIKPIQSKEGDIIGYTASETGAKELLEKENAQILYKIFEKKFEYAENISLPIFVDKILNITNHFNVSDRELNSLISEYTIKTFGDKNNVSLMNSLVKSNKERYAELSLLAEQKERNVISSTYRKITDNSYIERRDNKYYYIQIDDNGKIKEGELSYYGNIITDSNQMTKIERLDSHYSIVNKITENEEDKNRRVYRISNENQNSIIISLDKDLASLKIHEQKDKYKDLGILSFEEFRNLEMANPLIKEFRENAFNGKYTQIMNDAKNPYEIKGVLYTQDIDERSRMLNMDDMTNDLRTIQKLFPQNGKGDKIVTALIEELLDKTYCISQEKQKDGCYFRKEEHQKEIDIVKKYIIQNKGTKEEIENSLNNLNNNRKNIIKENSKHALVHFANEDAQKKYNEKQRIEKIVNHQKQEFKAKEILGKMGISSYYESEGELSKDKFAFGLKGIYYAGPEFDDRKRILLIDKFVEDFSGKTSEITDKTILEDLSKKSIQKILNGAYGISKKYARKSRITRKL